MMTGHCGCNTGAIHRHDADEEIATLKLKNQEMLAVLIALADRVSVRFGDVIKYEPVATGRYLDAAYEVIRNAKTWNQIGEGNCCMCGARVERLYSQRCPFCYDRLLSGQEK